MTKQEMFDRAYIGVVTQGRICRNPISGACAYYDPATKARCAWGHVLTEEQAKKSPPGVCNGGCAEYNKSLGFTDNDLRFGRQLQVAHDQAENLAAFQEQMKDLAAYFHLTIPEVTSND